MQYLRNKTLFSIAWILIGLNIPVFSQCTPVVTGTSTTCGIINFKLSNLNHNSPDKEGYVDYTAFSASVYKTMTYTTVTTTGNTSMQDIGAWVDWNQDLDFADAGEKVLGPSKYNNAAPYIQTLKIPGTALSGSTRLRLISDLRGPRIDSCNTNQPSGDIEDYTLIIRDTVFATASQMLSPQFISPATEKKVLCIELFSTSGFILSSLTFNTTGTSNIGAISNAKVFYSGLDPSFANIQVGTTFASPSGVFVINGAQTLQPGLNYLWLTYDVNGNAGDIIDAQLQSLVVNGASVVPALSSPPLQLVIKPAVCNYNPKRNNIWYFGLKAGLNFNNSPPTALAGSRMVTDEGCASIADKNGNLLFYTDGDTVYDKNNSPMPNGWGLGGISSGPLNGASQTALIIQQPDNDFIYYVFTVIPTEEQYKGFYYSIVDLSKNGGNGDVIVKKACLLNFALEKQTAVMHSNKRDIWILCHRSQSDAYYAYLLTPTDLKDPTVTNAGYIPTTNPSESIGIIKVSPDGKKVATSLYGNSPNTNKVELFDFNTSTGSLSNLKTLTSFTYNPYGIAFSPNNNLLYVTENAMPYNLSQFDATLSNAAFIMASKVFIAGGCPGHIELAPDGKIYVAQFGGSSLPGINSPDIAGIGCSFGSGISIAGNCHLGLPSQFIPASPPVALAAISTTICAGAIVTMSVSGGNSYLWIPSAGLSAANTATVSASPIITTTYTAIVSNTGSCPDSAFVIITINNTLVTDAGPNDTICKGQTATLNGSGGSSYLWNTGATTSFITISPSSTTSYTITSSLGNCTATDSAKVIVYAFPTVDAGLNDTICKGQTATLNGSGSSSYLWNTGATTASINVSPSTTSSYTVTTYNGICAAVDSAKVVVYATPIANAGLDETICKGQTATLNGSGGGSYLWSNGATSSSISISPSSTTSYTVTTSLGNCTATDSAKVIVYAVPIADAGFNDTICEGQITTLNGNGGSSYLWNTGETSSSISVSPSSNTSYTITAYNSICFSVDSAKVIVYALPTADAGSNTTIEMGSSTTLSANGGSSYLWSPSGGLSCITCSNPVASPQATTEYCVTVIVDTICGEVFVPTAFSPNKDGGNDSLCLYGTTCVKEIDFKIYNRWGEKIFETNNPKMCWDGIYQGQELNEGIYIYRFNATLYNDRVIIKRGNLTLIK